MCPFCLLVCLQPASIGAFGHADSAALPAIWQPTHHIFQFSAVHLLCTRGNLMQKLTGKWTNCPFNSDKQTDIKVGKQKCNQTIRTDKQR